MSLKFLIPALSLLAASAAAPAAQSAPQGPAGKSSSRPAASADKICIEIEPTTGSRIEKKLECKTRQEWARAGVNLDEISR
jgi:hypothetical protein